MEKSTSVNDLIGSLPRMIQAWAFYYDGKRYGTVRAYSEREAYSFIDRTKYPDKAKMDMRYIGIVGNSKKG